MDHQQALAFMGHMMATQPELPADTLAALHLNAGNEVDALACYTEEIKAAKQKALGVVAQLLTHPSPAKRVQGLAALKNGSVVMGHPALGVGGKGFIKRHDGLFLSEKGEMLNFEVALEYPYFTLRRGDIDV